MYSAVVHSCTRQTARETGDVHIIYCTLEIHRVLKCTSNKPCCSVVLFSLCCGGLRLGCQGSKVKPFHQKARGGVISEEASRKKIIVSGCPGILVRR